MTNMATGGVLEVRLSGAGAAWGPVCDDRFDQNGNQVGARPRCRCVRPLVHSTPASLG